VELPMPRPVSYRGQRLPATYMNFYFVNGGLLVPVFGQPRRDEEALAIFRRLLPRREVVGIDCRALIWGLGAIHCLTQQQPKSGASGASGASRASGARGPAVPRGPKARRSG
jgi:agmatine deiminase